MNTLITKYIIILKNNFLYFIIGILVLVVLFQNCSSNNDVSASQEVKTKATIKYIPVKGDVITLPGLIKTIPGKKEKIYLPDPNYDKLVNQYNDLVKAYTAKNIQSNHIKIDSIGYIDILDTVSKNVIIGRKVRYDFKIPETTIIRTIKAPIEKHNELYYGGGLEGGITQLVNQFNIGLLLKTKQDNIYNLYGGIDLDGHPQIGLQLYWKIKLRKQ
jgi:hypothetical protein